MVRHARGISLIEILIVISIIGLLLALTIPAIQSSRETARRTECKNKLRQLHIFVEMHNTDRRTYPSGGWCYSWVGDPDRGPGKEQPGSWAFSILDYVEESVSQIAKGKSGRQKSEAIVQMNTIPIPIFTCPTRRDPATLPVDKIEPGLRTNDSFQLQILKGFRGDYAINTGDFGTAEVQGLFPRTPEEVEHPDFEWYDTSKYTGISFGRSEVKAADITDGLSKTYLIGEKTISTENYLTGKDYGDNDTLYSGFDEDNGRTAANPPELDHPRSRISAFGSAHVGTWNVVFCDGSVHSLSYSIDRDLHKRLANRSDGQSAQIPRAE